MCELSIVIPVYNEGPNIEATLRALRENVRVAHEILIVYDFEGDTTLPVVNGLCPEFDNVRLLRNTVCRGPSGAIRTGMAQASARRVLVMMADLCDDLTQIPKLIELVPEKADIACPSRYCPGGEQRLKTSVKKLAPRAAGYLLRLFAGLPTYDPTNSFKMYSASMLAEIFLVSTVSFSVTLEIVAKAHCLGYRIVEIPTTWLDRNEGSSNFNLGRSLLFYMPWFLAALLRGRVVRLPQRWLRNWFAAPRRSAAARARAD